jgi:hypothetical protein
MWTLAARRTFALLIALAAAAGPARAEFFRPAPPSTLFDTSVRSAAMGGASTAVTWGEPGIWANPATLSGVSGVGWTTSQFKTLPGLADELEFSSQRVLIGGGGIGFSLMGQPLSGLGKAQFDQGPIILPLGDEGPSPYDRTEGWGVGISPLKLIESMRKLGKLGPAGLTSYGDVSFGYQNKSSKGVIPGSFEFDLAGTYDWGVTGRLALARWWGTDAPFRLDLSGGYAQVNVLKSDNENSAAETQQVDRTGAALHLSPAPRPSAPPRRLRSVVEAGRRAGASIGLAYDREHHTELPGGFQRRSLRIRSERLPAAGAAWDTFRSRGEIEGWTYGGGLSLPIGPWGSVGWQVASVPLADGLDRQFRQGWTVWVDPTRIWSDSR